MTDIQTISVVVAATSVVIAAIGTLVQNRKAERTRQTELIMQLFSPFNDPELVGRWDDIVNHWEWKDYDDYMKRYGRKNTEATKFISVASFFNSLGLLVKMGLLDASMVTNWSPEAVLWFWEKMEPIVQESREKLKAAGRTEYKIWEWVEYLYNETQRREQRLQQTQQ